MNTERYQFWAYLATLATLVAVFVAALVAASLNPTIVGRLEAFGLGTITGGLIGILRLPQKQTSDATVSAALNKLPDAPTVTNSPTPVIVSNTADQAVPVASTSET